MSAAANAAGYLYAHGLLPMSHIDAQVDAERPQRTQKSQSSSRAQPNSASPQDQSTLLKRVRSPRIEYRKRRLYALPSAA